MNPRPRACGMSITVSVPRLLVEGGEKRATTAVPASWTRRPGTIGTGTGGG